MSENYLTAKEFAKAAGVSVQTIYKQMNSRLSPYVKTIKGQKRINTDALQEFYDINEQLQTTEIQSKTTETDKKIDRNQPKTTFENQLNSTCSQPETDLEKRIGELEKLLQKQIEEDKQEKEFLRDQIRQKDKTIESLTENLKIAQQLAAADKKKLLEIEQKQQNDIEDKEQPIEAKQDNDMVSADAYSQEQDDQATEQKKEEESRGLKAFFKWLFK